MKTLLKRREELRSDHDFSIQTSDLSQVESRRKHYNEAGIIIEQQMAIDHVLEEIRRNLCQIVLVKGFKDIEHLSRIGSSQHLISLLQILTSISEALFGEGVDLDEIYTQFVAHVEMRRQGGDSQVPDYAAEVRRIKADAVKSLSAFCDQHRIPSPLSLS